MRVNWHCVDDDDVYNKLRKFYFGSYADKGSYTDSFVIGKAIDDCILTAQQLNYYAFKEKSMAKKTKSINLRKDSYSKLQNIAKELSIKESYALRLILTATYSDIVKAELPASEDNSLDTIEGIKSIIREIQITHQRIEIEINNEKDLYEKLITILNAANMGGRN